jgi:hypothetical protein
VSADGIFEIPPAEALARPVEVVTKSRLAVWNRCQRLEDLTYRRGYRPVVESEAMAWGSLLHAGLEKWWLAHQHGEALIALQEAEAALAAYRDAHATAIDEAAFARALVLIVAYDARWAASMADYDVLGVEVEFVAMIPGRRRLRVAGKLDALVRRRSDGAVLFVEHKSSGADLSAGSTYFQRLRMDPQVSIYFAGCRELGHEPVACLYDIVVRPDLRPLRATPIEKRKLTKDGRLYANQRETDETTDQFRERLSAAVIAAPESYFVRVEVVRLESELEASQADVEETALQIRSGSQTGVSPRNPSSCFLYGRTCEFLSVCDGTASLDDETKFRRVDKTHEELGAPKTA